MKVLVKKCKNVGETQNTVVQDFKSLLLRIQVIKVR